MLAGDVPTVRNPIWLSATPVRYDLPPPALDSHGDAVRDWLGAGGAHDHPEPAAEPPVPSA